MVGLNRARAWAEDSSGVELESDTGVEGNRKWSLVVESGNHISSSNVGVSLNLDNSQGRVEFTGLLDSSVWIAVPGFNSSVLGKPSVGSVHISSVASFIQLITVNQLLWGKGEEFLVDDLVLSLKGGRSGESPARSARSLVLDISDGTLVNPVEFAGWGSSVSGSNDWLLFLIVELNLLESGVEVDEFLLSQIREKGQSELGIGVSLAELLNFVEVFDENQQSVLFSQSILVDLVESGLPVFE